MLTFLGGALKCDAHKYSSGLECDLNGWLIKLDNKKTVILY